MSKPILMIFLAYITCIVKPKPLFMKKLFAFLLSATFSVASFSTSVSIIKPSLKANEVYLPIGKSGQMISIQDLSTIKMKDFEGLTGKKMKLMDKIGFVIGQKQLRKSINPDGTFSRKKVEKYFNKMAEGGGFQAGGFFLGFLLGLIGVLIAYLIKDDKKKNRVKWAWIGFGIGLVISIIIIATSSVSIY